MLSDPPAFATLAASLDAADEAAAGLWAADTLTDVPWVPSPNHRQSQPIMTGPPV